MASLATNFFDEVASFDALGLRDDVLRGIQAMGFDAPTAIQRRTMLPILRGRDLLAQAACGTGKTAAYSIPLLQRIDPTVRSVQALVLVPARGLALQVCAVIEQLGARAGVRALACVGGTDIASGRSDVSQLRLGGVHVVVGTPARILDLIAQGSRPLRTDALRLIVLDEADQLVAPSSDFAGQMRDIFGAGLPKTVQVAMFSATVTTDVLAAARDNLRTPAVVLAESTELTPKSIRHFAVTLEPEDKASVLADVWGAFSGGGAAHAIAFCNSTARVEALAASLRALGVSPTVLHGGLGQGERESVLAAFRARGGLLIATDLLSRGLDVQQLQLVFNADLPASRESYVHRTGRAGRCGRQGVAVSLVLAGEERYLRDIEAAYGCTIAELPADLAGLVPSSCSNGSGGSAGSIASDKPPVSGAIKTTAVAPAPQQQLPRPPAAAAASAGAAAEPVCAAPVPETPSSLAALAAAEERAASADTRAAAAEERARQAEERAKQAEERAKQAEAAALAQAAAAEAALAALQQECAAARLAASDATERAAAAEQRVSAAEACAARASERAERTEAMLVAAASSAFAARAHHPGPEPTMMHSKVISLTTEIASPHGSAHSVDHSSVSADDSDGNEDGAQELWLRQRPASSIAGGRSVVSPAITSALPVKEGAVAAPQVTVDEESDAGGWTAVVRGGGKRLDACTPPRHQATQARRGPAGTGSSRKGGQPVSQARGGGATQVASCGISIAGGAR